MTSYSVPVRRRTTVKRSITTVKRSDTTNPPQNYEFDPMRFLYLLVRLPFLLIKYIFVFIFNLILFSSIFVLCSILFYLLFYPIASMVITSKVYKHTLKFHSCVKDNDNSYSYDEEGKAKIQSACRLCKKNSTLVNSFIFFVFLYWCFLISVVLLIKFRSDSIFLVPNVMITIILSAICMIFLVVTFIMVNRTSGDNEDNLRNNMDYYIYDFCCDERYVDTNFFMNISYFAVMFIFCSIILYDIKWGKKLIIVETIQQIVTVPVQVVN